MTARDTAVSHRRTTLAMTAVAIAGLVVSPPIAAQQRVIRPSTFTGAPMIQAPSSGEVEVLPIRGNVFAIFGAGANIVVSGLCAPTPAASATVETIDSVSRTSGVCFASIRCEA